MAKRRTLTSLIKVQPSWRTPAKTPSSLLRRAVRVFEDERRWAKGYYYFDGFGNTATRDTASRVCAVGACRLVKDGTTHSVYTRACVALGQAARVVKPGVRSVVDLNDHGTTTITDIRRVFRKAIQTLRMAGQ